MVKDTKVFQETLNQLIDVIKRVNEADVLEGTIDICMNDGTASITRTTNVENIKEEFQILDSTLKIKGNATFLVNQFAKNNTTIIVAKLYDD